MSKSKKGLSDEGRGDFVLNESGTSINVDHVNDTAKPAAEDEPGKKENESDEPYIPPVADPQKDITD
jgi:hypothetical protein